MEKMARSGLGPLEARFLSKLSAEIRGEVFTFSEAKALLKLSGRSLANLLYRLVESRWVEHIERGRYLLLPLDAGPAAEYATNPLIIARKLASPYYIGFATALNYYGITEQASGITYIATIRQKKTLHFHSDEYKFVTLAEKRFFGMKEEWIGNLKFNISEKEKTIVDCLFMPEYCGGLTEVVKAFKDEIDYGKLYEYTLRMEDRSVIKKLGYLLDVLNLNPEIAEKLREKVGGGFALLDPSGRKSGRVMVVNKKWRIIENISVSDLEVEL